MLALALGQAVLFLGLQARLGLVSVILWYVGPIGLALLALMTVVAGVIWSALRSPFWNRGRGIGYLIAVSVMLVSGLAYRVYPSSYDGRPSAIAFRLPLDGRVTVAWGGSTEKENYHVVHPDQRWAYDLVVTSHETTHRAAGDSMEQYHAYGRPVLAPAAGTVYAVHDGEPDAALGSRRKRTRVAGNHVVLEVAPNEFLFINHLRPGSLQVSAGEHVRAGQPVGRVGNSGNSSEPHVHIHLQSTPQIHFGEAIPMHFHCYRVGDQLVQRGMPTGGVIDGMFVGQVVENVPHCRQQG